MSLSVSQTTLFCQIGETEWADSLVYGAREPPRPTITAGSHLRLQLWMPQAHLEATMPREQGVRLVRVEEPTYEVSARVRRVAVRELYRIQPPRVVGYALLDSLPPMVLVLERMETKSVEELRGKFVAVTGTLMGTFYKVFWNPPFSSWLDAEVREVRDGPGDNKVLEVAI